MLLLRKIVVVAIAVAGLGCHDVAGPTLPATFILDTINGRQLPTPLVFFPESPVITSGSLQLEPDGTAVMVEDRDVMIAPGHVTNTTNYTYTIRDNVIEFHLDCPPTAFCSAPPIGVFRDSHLFLQFNGDGGSIVYDYELAPRIEN